MTDILPLSIIMPTYNRGHLIGRMMQSALSQSFLEYEFVIIDDGSTDNTESVVKQYQDERIVYCKHAQNQGVSVARNYGIQRAKGQYITFVDSDDYLVGDLYTEMYNQATETEADICINRYAKNMDGFEVKYVSPFEYSFIRTHSILYTRKLLLERQLLFPSGIQCGEDVYFLLCALLEASSVIEIKQAARYQYCQHNGKERLTRQENMYSQVMEMMSLLKCELQLRSPVRWQVYMKWLVKHYRKVFMSLVTDKSKLYNITDFCDSLTHD